MHGREKTMAEEKFELVSNYAPTGDQPQAIAQLVEGVQRGDRCQTLLGVTGSGKTFTMANVIAQCNRPTLVLAHNKNAGGTAVYRVPLVFPQQCGGVLRQLLRLLPAGGLHSQHRYLY